MKLLLTIFIFLTCNAIDTQEPILDLGSPLPIAPEKIQEIWYQSGIELEPIRNKSHVTVQKMTVQRRINTYFRCRKKRDGYRFPGRNYLWNLDRSLRPRPSSD